jgi:hypothetical protein
MSELTHLNLMVCGLTWLSVLPPQCSDVCPHMGKKGVRPRAQESIFSMALGEVLGHSDWIIRNSWVSLNF